jgi:hypothetical protein
LILSSRNCLGRVVELIAAPVSVRGAKRAYPMIVFAHEKNGQNRKLRIFHYSRIAADELIVYNWQRQAVIRTLQRAISVAQPLGDLCSRPVKLGQIEVSRFRIDDGVGIRVAQVAGHGNASAGRKSRIIIRNYDVYCGSGGRRRFETDIVIEKLSEHI